MPARTWWFGDCDRPPPRTLGDMTSHEAIMVTNPGSETANLEFTLYRSDREPTRGIRVQVPGERVLGFRLERLPGPNGLVDVPPRLQYAIRIDSDQDVIAAYGRVECGEPGGLSVLGYPGHV